MSLRYQSRHDKVVARSLLVKVLDAHLEYEVVCRSDKETVDIGIGNHAISQAAYGKLRWVLTVAQAFCFLRCVQNLRTGKGKARALSFDAKGSRTPHRHGSFAVARKD